MFSTIPYLMLLLAAVATTTAITAVHAQILDRDAIPNLPLDGNATLGEIDLSVDFTDGLLPANGTQTLPTTGITDVDITSLPAPPLTFILDNDSATVTSHPVTIDVDESSDDSSSSSSSSSDDEDD